MADFRLEQKYNKLRLFFFSLYILIALNLVRMQFFQHQYYDELAQKNRLRVIYLEGPRGQIVDRNGEVLATNRISYDLAVIPAEAKKELKKSLSTISMISGLDSELLSKKFKKAVPGALNTVVLIEDMEASKAMALEERLETLPGFMIQTRPRRQYPLGEASAHILGYLSPMTEQEAELFIEWYGYRKSQWVGRDGIEKSYESFLRGHDGGFQVEVDSRGRFKRYLGIKEPKEGQTLRLSVDARLQRLVQELIADKKAAVVVMNVKTGAVLSLNSSPSFDSNDFVNIQKRKEVGKYFKDQRAPMLNRVLMGQYPPGSIYKIVTATAALMSGKVTSYTKFICPGYFMLGNNRFACWHDAGHGPQDVVAALEHSCNCYFYRAGLAAGIDLLTKISYEFGLGQMTGLDLPHEKKGLVPGRDWKMRMRSKSWFDGETVNMAIGQGYLQLTPMQAVVMTAAAANKGWVPSAYLVESVGSSVIERKKMRKMKVDDSVFSFINSGLLRVVDSNSGTGRLSRVPGLKIAAKTGTAQSGQDQTHAWYVGYAPFDKPEYAVTVFVENGGRGGVVAAKIAQPIFAWLKLKKENTFEK